MKRIVSDLKGGTRIKPKVVGSYAADAFAIKANERIAPGEFGGLIASLNLPSHN